MTTSPFLNPGLTAKPNSLAVLHLRRDLLIPAVLHKTPAQTTGYAEGFVTNTRFGSYPHSTLIDLAWGSQVLASNVDTGSRGRKPAASKPNANKRKADALDLDLDENADGFEHDGVKPLKAAVVASSGFCHILPPTPESWTVSLPHRTQVVYTPDYSFVLQKLKVRPGSVVIEAGAGSGSFTHAAARAVYNGTPPLTKSDDGLTVKAEKQYGQVYSFEYHAPRAESLREELIAHGLDDVVRVTHRDVYTDGFLLDAASRNSTENSDEEREARTTPPATTVFLDLPAPWQALPHLTRREPTPLSPHHPIHICTFLPCIEQVQRAVTTLRQHGWVEINMQELQHHRIEARRERVGLEWEGQRGVNSSAATVEESVARLLEVGERAGDFRGREKEDEEWTARKQGRESKMQRLERLKKEVEGKKTFKEGRLVHRTEAELKTHTSYLVFAVLPIEI